MTGNVGVVTNTQRQFTGAKQIVVMGVSGSGKTTIGTRLADALSIRFVDGDSLHPEANVAKMAAGKPLNDDDRRPWLKKVGAELHRAGSGGLVVACSALKVAYRSAILGQAPDAVFVHLHGSREVLASRMAGRTGHFMPSDLLESQLSTLEPLGEDEPGFVIDIDQSVDAVVNESLSRLRPPAH